MVPGDLLGISLPILRLRSGTGATLPCMPNSRTQRVASLRRTVAVSTLVVFMAAWGAVVKLGPGGNATSSASTALPSSVSDTSSQGTASNDTASNDTSSQAPAPLTTSQS